MLNVTNYFGRQIGTSGVGAVSQTKFMFIVIPLNIETILLIIFYSSFASVP